MHKAACLFSKIVRQASSQKQVHSNLGHMIFLVVSVECTWLYTFFNLM